MPTDNNAAHSTGDAGFSAIDKCVTYSLWNVADARTLSWDFGGI